MAGALEVGGSASFVGEGEVGGYADGSIFLSGIAGAEAFGTAAISQRIGGHGIATAESLDQTAFIERIATSQTLNSTNASVLLPPGAASGKLGIMIISGRTGTITWPSGWTEFFNDTNSIPLGTALRLAGAYRALDGSETGSVTASHTNACDTQHWVSVIDDWDGTTVPEAATFADDDIDPNPPSLSPSWGAEKTRWIAVGSGASYWVVAGFPTDYINDQYGGAGGVTGVTNMPTLAVASRAANTATENPAAFDYTGTPAHTIAATIAVRSKTSSLRVSQAQSVVADAIAGAEAFGTAQINLRLLMSGVASAEAFGTAYLNAIQTLTANGIASDEAHGSHAVTSGSQLITGMTGIAGAEAFGTASLNLRLLMAAIASAEALGTPTLSRRIAASGIASLEAFGTAKLNLRLLMAAIASLEAFGTARLNRTIGPAGNIASLEAFGTAKLSPRLLMAAIASGEAFGTAKLNLRLLMAGIASAEAFGTLLANVIQKALPSSIASAEALGSPKVNLAVTLSGIASAEVFGTAQINRTITANGIVSDETFGSALVKLVQTVVADSIASAEAVGTPQVGLIIRMTGVASLEAFGSPALSVSIGAIGVVSQEAFGTARVNLAISVVGIESGEVVAVAHINYTPDPETSYRVHADNRTTKVAAENRTTRVPPENRTTKKH